MSTPTYTTTFDVAISILKALVKKAFLTDPTRKTQSYTFDLSNDLAVHLSSGTPNATAGGGDTVLAVVLPITASGTADIDLHSFTDLAERATQLFARIKFWGFWLPSVTDDAIIGTACSSVSIGNAGGDGTNGNALDLSATTDTQTVKNSGWKLISDGSAAGIAVDATHKLVHCVNNDSVHAGNLVAIFAGGGT